MATPPLHGDLLRDMDRIRGEVVEMSALGQRALRQCVEAMFGGDRQKAYAIILRDLFIDEQEKKIDRLCLEFLIRQQPVAGPLRFVFAAIKIDLELERVGDYAEGIARQIVKLISMGADYPREPFARIADAAILMLRDAAQAFATEDAALARDVIEREEGVDLLKRDLSAQLAELHRAGRLPLAALNALLSIVRRFERVSDQARNISQEALYLCTGRLAKHPGTDVFRVLFVDACGSGPARVAEAVGAALANRRFAFASAAIDPRPPPAAATEYLRELGVDPARAVPRALAHVPELGHFHVAILLSPAARGGMELLSRKGVVLEWFVEDPGAQPGDPAATRAAFARLRESLERQVRELVEAVLGGERLKPGGT